MFMSTYIYIWKEKGFKMKQLIYLIMALLCVGIALATVPTQIVGKPSIYDNGNKPVYENGLVLFMRFDNESALQENDSKFHKGLEGGNWNE